MSITQERRLGHKPWAESLRDAWPRRVPASKPIDDEQHGRRRHVAAFGQHLARHGTRRRAAAVMRRKTSTALA